MVLLPKKSFFPPQNYKKKEFLRWCILYLRVEEFQPQQQPKDEKWICENIISTCYASTSCCIFRWDLAFKLYHVFFCSFVYSLVEEGFFSYLLGEREAYLAVALIRNVALMSCVGGTHTQSPGVRFLSLSLSHIPVIALSLLLPPPPSDWTATLLKSDINI